MQPGPNSNPENIRNVILAVVISITILLAWNYFFPTPQPTVVVEETAAPQMPSDVAIPLAPQNDVTASAVKAFAAKSAPVLPSPRVTINTDALHGSIALRGARIDTLTLADYYQTVDCEKEVQLLYPARDEQAYFIEHGWVASNANTLIPDKNTLWQVQGDVLTQNTPLVLTWDNGQGLQFVRTITLDEHYMFKVQQKVVNNTGTPVTLYPYALINRQYKDEGQGFYILHEGPLGVFDQVLEERGYDDLQDEGKETFKDTQGWVGITDKYWLTALVPGAGERFTAHLNHYTQGEHDRYQVDYLGKGVTIAAGASGQAESHVFAGAKKVSLLDGYMEGMEIPLFDRAVDFGMLYFLTRPIFAALEFFFAYLGNFGLAILALTVVIKLILFPLANKSYKSMSAMKLLMPKIEEIRERYGDDRMKMNEEMMALYKREKVNPMSGCLPILLQMPIFFALYKVLFVTIEMRHAPFYGWIDDLSALDPTNLFTLFGTIPWDPPSILHIGLWPLIMAGTMIIQQKLNPKPSDPVQAQVMGMLPFIFLFLFASFPAGLVIYWAWNNFLSIVQQWIIMRRYKAQTEAKGG